jgi:hypothetical protein
VVTIILHDLAHSGARLEAAFARYAAHQPHAVARRGSAGLRVDQRREAVVCRVLFGRVKCVQGANKGPGYLEHTPHGRINGM